MSPDGRLTIHAASWVLFTSAIARRFRGLIGESGVIQRLLTNIVGVKWLKTELLNLVDHKISP